MMLRPTPTDASCTNEVQYGVQYGVCRIQIVTLFLVWLFCFWREKKDSPPSSLLWDGWKNLQPTP
jgi:hypothetical protein